MFKELKNWKNWSGIEGAVFVAVVFLALTQVFDILTAIFQG
jgi:hypothetical protein